MVSTNTATMELLRLYDRDTSGANTAPVANIPAEISHLMDEIQVKDRLITDFKDEINKRDAQLQKWVRVNGGHVLNPKEEAFSKAINECFDKCEILQAEKCGLAEKAQIILDRQVKRLDVGLRGLIQTEQFPSDWGGPTLLGSGTTTGVSTPIAVGNTPLQQVSGNIGSTGGAPNVAQSLARNAAQLHMSASTGSRARGTPTGGQTPTNMPRSQREGSSDVKKRKLNASVSLPASGLRQSSLGPGTPKAGTPVPAGVASSRAGSAQPAAAQKKGAHPPAGNRKVAPPQSKKSGRSRPSGHKKSDRRRQLARDRATPSTNASLSDESGDEDGTSPTPSSIQRSQGDGMGDGVDDNDDDETLYCFCKKVSYGDMVGCDNDNCPYQWFHYKCVGVTEEPTGEWLCPECRKKPKKELRINKS